MNLSTHHSQRRSLTVMVVLTLFVFGSFGVVFYQSVNGSTDTDGDGYASIATGGTDCQDTSSSVYKDTVDCDDTAAPAFLAATGDPDGTNDIADHAWIQDSDGLYHLYFQWNGPDTDIAHFTSTDLKSITYVGTALAHDTSTYYGRIWAPSIIKNGDTYYMFFTGVEKYVSTAYYRQRIGLATSTNLTDWTLYPGNNCSGTNGNGCIYECDNSWTTWGNGTAYDEQCRDPMVIRDDTNSRWVMFSTIKRNDGSGSEAIDVAYSTDLVNWTGTGYIKATQRLTVGQGGTGGQTTGGTSENPYAFEHDGTYYLTFTDWSDSEPPAEVQYVKSSTLTGDSSGSTNWTYQGNIADSGVNAIEILKVEGDTWLMTQSITNSNSGDSVLHYRELRVKRIVWNSDGTFTTSKLSDLDCRVSSASINPGAEEICDDGIDNNCSGEADEASVCDAVPGDEGGGDDDPTPVDSIDGVSGVTINGTAATVNNSLTTVAVTARQPVITGIAEPNATITLALFPGPFIYWTTSNGSGAWTISITDLLPKATYSVYARVAADSQTTSVEKIAVMSIRSGAYLPIPTVTSPTSGEYVISTTPSITGFTKSGTTVHMYIDTVFAGSITPATRTSGTSPFLYTLTRSLSKGEHTFAIEATDANGNFSRRSAPLTFTVSDPTIGPTLYSPTSGNGSWYLNGIGWGDTDVIVYDNGVQLDIFYIGGAQTQTFSHPLPTLSSGTHTITTRAYDAAGRPSRTSNAVTITQ